MTIPDHALEAAARALNDAIQPGTFTCRDLARAVVEAYEQALWRPIEESPPVDGTYLLWSATAQWHLADGTEHPVPPNAPERYAVVSGNNEGWFEQFTNHDVFEPWQPQIGDRDAPTHFRPLTPPKET